MDDPATLYTEAKAFLIALGYTMPRILALFIAIPIFNQQLIPGFLRFAIAGVIGLVVAPSLMSQATLDGVGPKIVFLILKEGFIGFVLGYLIAIPFWAFEGVGFFIDNQRGASIAATLNPLTGNDTSPLGILFNQAFIVFFFVAGGFLLMLELIYQSFEIWSVFSWTPHLRAETVGLLLQQLDGLVSVVMLLSAPVIIAMFLAEMGLALVSRFVPQLQVFFIAMPIKCALAMLVLMIYFGALFDYGMDQIDSLRSIVPTLNDQWRPPVGGAQ